MTAPFYKNMFLILVCFLGLLSCSEKVYVPYTYLTEDVYSNKELYGSLLDSKTGDIYRPYQEKTIEIRRFELKGLLTDDYLEIPFQFDSKNAFISEIHDSIMYFSRYDPKGEWDSLKTIKYKITKKGFIPVDSLTQPSLNTGILNSYFWKDGCETIFWRLTGRDFQNGIESKIILLDSIENNKYSWGICSESGRFKITQARCSDDALIYSKEIETGLSKYEKFSEVVIIKKLYHVENKIFLIISPKYFLNEIILGWLDLESGKFKKTKITNYYRSGTDNGFRPVLYDKKKKL